MHQADLRSQPRMLYRPSQVDSLLFASHNTLYYYDMLLGLYCLYSTLPTILLNPKKEAFHSLLPRFWYATPFKSGSCFSKHTKQQNKNAYPPVIFCEIQSDNLKNPPSLPRWLLSVFHLFKGISFSLETERV